MKSKLVAVLVVLAVVSAGCVTWVAVHQDDGKGPWMPATASVGWCGGVTVRRPLADGVAGPGRVAGVWVSVEFEVPEEWRGVPGRLDGEFRRIPDSGDGFGRLRAEFRAGRTSVELTTGVEILC